MVHGLCFIDWATKCFEGTKYNSFYDYKVCDDWIEKEIERLFEILHNLNLKLNNPDISNERQNQIKYKMAIIKGFQNATFSLRDSCDR